MQHLFDIPELPANQHNEWYTPSKYIEAARAVMGSIDLDPASCERANQTVKATTYYTREQNGLALPWYGNVWLNPPYDKPKPWINKYCKKNDIDQGILLVSACTDIAWFDPLWEYIICFKKGRMKFHNPYKSKSGSARDPSLFIYRGTNEQQFIDIFSQFGPVAKRISPTHSPAYQQRPLF